MAFEKRKFLILLAIISGILVLLQIYIITTRPAISESIRDITDDVSTWADSLLNVGPWDSGYNISTRCSVRPNAKNPFKDFDAFACPSLKPFADIYPQVLSESPLGPYSSRTCSDEKHCVYENVCVKERQVMFFPHPSDKSDAGSFGWEPYRDGGRRTFSWHYGIHLERNISKWGDKVRWISGTNLWFDQSYDHMCHPGHSSEFYNKLVQFRDQFPDTIDRIIYAYDSEVQRKSPHAYKMCAYPCHLMRLAFEREGWDYPNITWLIEPIGNQYEKKFRFTEDYLCFEKLLVPANEFQHFTSLEAADRHRDKALKMCNIPHRRKPRKADTKNVLFYQRGWGRQISNGEELCNILRNSEYNVKTSLETDNVEDFCQMVATMYAADIIVTVEGSSNFMLPFARPGSVVILVFPYKFRIPDWKLMAYYAGLRVLELITTNASYSIGGPLPKWRLGDKLLEVADTSFRDCTHIMCRVAIRNRDTYLPYHDFEMFFKHALQLLRQSDNASRLPCEKPLPWPVQPTKEQIQQQYWHTPYWQTHWAQYGFENNYAVCEPPAPDCLCCKNQQCMEATNGMKRPI